MKIISSLIIAILAANCFANPTTQPSQPAPTPQVAVFAFNNVGPADQAWVAQAINENFIAELSRTQAVWPVRAISQSPNQSDQMMTAKNSGATYLLTGAYQIIDDQLRVTGEIISVDDGHAMGGLTATGATRDLFSIEDTLAMQAKRLLSPPVNPSMTAPAPIMPSGPVATNAPMVTNDFSAAAYVPPDAFVPQYEQYAYYSVPFVYGGCGYCGVGCGFVGHGFGFSGLGFHSGFVHGFHGSSVGFTHNGFVGRGGAMGHPGW